MALDNYANLRESIKQWSHRDEMDEHSADCIIMAEQELFYGQTPFRIPEMIATSETSESTIEFSLPSGCLEIVKLEIKVDGDYYLLDKITTLSIPQSDETGTPSAFTITSKVILNITPDKAYSFRFTFYQKPTALSDSNTTNVILQKYPTAYFFGGLAAAFMYCNEVELSNQYSVRMRDVIARANSDAENLLYGPNPVQIIFGSAP